MAGDEPGADEGPDHGRVQEHARERQHERTENVEEILRDMQVDFGELKFPVTTEELAVEYGDQELDLPNETESLGDVFDRLVYEEFESEDEVREAVYGEITGRAGPPDEYNDSRDLDTLDDVEEDDLEEDDVGTM